MTLGFNERQSHRTSDISGCLVVEPGILTLLASTDRMENGIISALISYSGAPLATVV